MAGDADIATVAALLADPTRVNILLALSDGKALPAGELAQRARVARLPLAGISQDWWSPILSRL